MKLQTDYDSNLSMLKQHLNIQQNFDITERPFYIGSTKANFYFIDGFLKDDIMERIFEFLMQLDVDNFSNLQQFEKHAIPYVEVTLLNDLDFLTTQLLSGASFCIIDGFDEAIVMDARTYPNRSISEPEDDRVLRGSRDSFVETLVFNTALIRRRIRDPHLTMQLFQVGSKSKTDIVLCYLSNCVDPNQLKSLTTQINAIDIPSLSLAQESLAECLIKKSWWNPFPRIRYTERPDTAVANVMEGKILCIIDNSPAVMLLPTSFLISLKKRMTFIFLL